LPRCSGAIEAAGYMLLAASVSNINLNIFFRSACGSTPSRDHPYAGKAAWIVQCAGVHQICTGSLPEDGIGRFGIYFDYVI
jgi:hypothetical protein